MSAACVDLSEFDAVLFDLDGVLTDTARLHEAAWAAEFTEIFDQIDRLSPANAPIAPFTSDDYRRLVDGEPRYEGVLHVLADRSLTLPAGEPADRPGSGTIWAVANAKDARYLELLHKSDARPFASSVALARALEAAGIRLGVVSASRHCAEVLEAAGIFDLFETTVDGWVAAAMRLPGKPDPAMYVEGAARLGVDPGRCVVIEDAVSGVQAGRDGAFGLVVGVDRRGSAAALRRAGAGIIVQDLAELRLEGEPRAPWLVELSGGFADETSRTVGTVEALGTLANGYLGVRGTNPWSRDDGTNYPGCYLAGVYNRLTVAVDGEQAEREAMVNIPNWLPFTFRCETGSWLGKAGVTVTDHRVCLDLRRGLLVRTFRTRDQAGRKCIVREKRLVSMAEKHLVAHELSVIAENWSGNLHIRLGIDANVTNNQTAEERLDADRHLGAIQLRSDSPDILSTTARTVQSDILVAESARIRLGVGVGVGYGKDETTHRATTRRHTEITQDLSVQIAERGRVSVEKVVAVFTSRDRAISEPALAADAMAATAPDFAELAASHALAWSRLWRRSELSVTLRKPDEHISEDARSRPGENVSSIVRLQLFHLLQVASPHVAELDVGIPARGLGGEGYLGHIFWDELFIYPVLNARFPDSSRAMLLYRHRRLPAARIAAQDAGHSGAMFPWQSGSDGRDETPHQLLNVRTGAWIPDNSGRQRHVGLALAYELWQNWQTTGDTAFFFNAGAEVFLECARFFASLATFDPALGRWRITGVMGPDEFHDSYPQVARVGIDDNAYTNVMIAWLLSQAIRLVSMIRNDHRTDVLAQLGVGDAELSHWEELTQTLYVPFHAGVISQFAGYEKLAELDLDAYRARYGNIGRLDLILDAEGDTVRNYQVTKQADALMLFYLFSAEELRAVLGRLGYALPPEMILRTVDYYSTRAAHGSSLSSVVHAWVQARSDRSGSWRQFQLALDTDFADIQGGTTAEGLHLGAMAGSVDLLQRCYTGIEVRDDALWLNPALPDEVERLRFDLTYRDHWVNIDVDHRQLVVTAAAAQAEPATIVLSGRRHRLSPGHRIEHPLS